MDEKNFVLLYRGIRPDGYDGEKNYSENILFYLPPALSEGEGMGGEGLPNEIFSMLVVGKNLT